MIETMPGLLMELLPPKTISLDTLPNLAMSTLIPQALRSKVVAKVIGKMILHFRIHHSSHLTIITFAGENLVPKRMIMVTPSPTLAVAPTVALKL
jgi:hypothetical protein